MKSVSERARSFVEENAFVASLVSMGTRLFSSARFRTSAGVLLLVASVGFLIFGIYSGRSQLEGYHWQVRPGGLCISVCLYALNFALLVIGWNSIMAAILRHADFRANLEIYCYSEVLKRLPTVVWFIMARVYLYAEKGISGLIPSLATALEIVAGITSGAMVHTLSLAITRRTPTSLSYLLVLVPFIGIPAIYLAVDKAGPLLAEGIDGDHKPPSSRFGWTRTAQWLFMYGASWVLGGAALHAFTLAIYQTTSLRLLDSIAVWTLTGVVASICLIAPTSLGIQEAILSFLLSAYMPLPIAIVVSVAFRFLISLTQVFLSISVVTVSRCCPRLLDTR